MAMTPKAFLKEAHRRHGAQPLDPRILTRTCYELNTERRGGPLAVTTDVLEVAIALEQETADGLAGVER